MLAPMNAAHMHDTVCYIFYVYIYKYVLHILDLRAILIVILSFHTAPCCTIALRIPSAAAGPPFVSASAPLWTAGAPLPAACSHGEARWLTLKNPSRLNHEAL